MKNNSLEKHKKRWKLLGNYLNEKCPKCEQKTVLFMDKYDARCCTLCNEWIDDVCGDASCLFCSQRPQTPYEEVYYYEEKRNTSEYGKHWRRENYQHKTNGMKRHNIKKEWIAGISEKK